MLGGKEKRELQLPPKLAIGTDDKHLLVRLKAAYFHLVEKEAGGEPIKSLRGESGAIAKTTKNGLPGGSARGSKPKRLGFSNLTYKTCQKITQKNF